MRPQVLLTPIQIQMASHSAQSLELDNFPCQLINSSVVLQLIHMWCKEKDMIVESASLTCKVLMPDLKLDLEESEICY